LEGLIYEEKQIKEIGFIAPVGNTSEVWEKMDSLVYYVQVGSGR
jgi:hypothetical protein